MMRWLKAIPRDKRLGLLNKHQYHIGVCIEVDE